jgi:hypothetical protein
MSYSRSIPNQILHYTASSANYPSHAIRVGNFAISDAGNAPTGSYGEFLGGLNPYAFTTSEASRIADFEKQTYTVYMQKNQCAGPACYLINDQKIVPNPGTDYPGGITPPQKPWYNLLKFTQYVVGSQSGSITSQIGYYGEGTSNVLSNSIAALRTTFQWYMDQRSTGDPNNYPGGTYGNRVVVNKFYPPLDFVYYDKLVDTSYTPCCIPIDDTTWYLKDLRGNYTSSVCSYDYEWDYEGGFIHRQLDDPGFAFSAHTGFDLSVTDWTMELYVNPKNLHNDPGGFFVMCGADSTQAPFFGFGAKDAAPNDEFFVNLNGTRYVIGGIIPDASRWYWFTLKKIGANDDLEIYVNGKYIYTVDLTPNPFPNLGNVSINLLGSDGSDSTLALQFFGFESGTVTPDEIKSRFLKYALNTKIKISPISADHKLKLALDTGTKASHRALYQWLDISGNDLHGYATSSYFDWANQGYKPGSTTTNFGITHSAALNNMFVNPFMLSIWVKFIQTGFDSNIFKKGRNEITMLNSGQILVTFDDGNLVRTYTSAALTSNKWYNIILTGTNPNQANLYIFSHTGSTQELLTGSSGGNPIDVTIDDTSNISVGGGNSVIASVIYFGDVFSQALANDFFAIQKGRFGYDSNENRIADLGDCLNP